VSPAPMVPMPARKNGTATWRVVLHHFSCFMTLLSLEMTVAMLATLCRDPAPGVEGALQHDSSSRVASCDVTIMGLATGMVDMTPCIAEFRETSMSECNMTPQSDHTHHHILIIAANLKICEPCGSNCTGLFEFRTTQPSRIVISDYSKTVIR